MRVVVVGGGVAGAVGAIALRQIGAQVTVLESRNDPAGQVGSFLSLAANGMKALRAVGMAEAVSARGIAVERQRMWSSSGRLLGDVPRARRANDPTRSVTLPRADLVEVLRQAAQDAGAEIATGRQVCAVRQLSDGAEVETTAGQRFSADLVIGADGIWSAVRRGIDPSGPTPEYAGMYTVSGSARMSGMAPGVFHMVFCRNGAFIYVPVAEDEIWWAAQVVQPRQEDQSRMDDQSWRRRLRDIYRHEAVACDILRNADRFHHAGDNHRLGPVAVTHTSHTVLIGDAAHPVGAGQGASMAIEDAVVLARRLRDHPDVPGALAAFARERAPRIAKLLKASDDNRAAKSHGPAARWLRDRMMALFVDRFYEKATGWLYDYDVEPEPVEVGRLRRTG